MYKVLLGKEKNLIYFFHLQICTIYLITHMSILKIVLSITAGLDLIWPTPSYK